MPESSDEVEMQERSPENVFSLLGNETRIGIIRALWRAGNDAVSFSELRERADVADSGQFNYHLGELVGTFVRREGDGYELTYAGRQVVGAILDGTYTKRASIDPFEIDVSCIACGSALEASYDDESFFVNCPDCDRGVAEFQLPPGALNGRTREELVAMTAHWIRAQSVFMQNGICPTCAGVVARSIETASELPGHEVRVEYDCERCVWSGHTMVGPHFLTHPAVVSFYHDHGVDLTEQWWEALMQSSNQPATVRSEDPWRISVTISVAGDELELIVDGDLNVVEQRRT